MVDIEILFHKSTAFTAHCRPNFGMLDQIKQALCSGRRVALRHQKGGLAVEHAFRTGAMTRRDNRQTDCLRFLKHQPLPFLIAIDGDTEMEKEMRGVHQPLQPFASESAVEMYDALEDELT